MTGASITRRVTGRHLSEAPGDEPKTGEDEIDPEADDTGSTSPAVVYKYVGNFPLPIIG
jgi:hypothetical protein